MQDFDPHYVPKPQPFGLLKAGFAFMALMAPALGVMMWVKEMEHKHPELKNQHKKKER